MGIASRPDPARDGIVGARGCRGAVAAQAGEGQPQLAKEGVTAGRGQTQRRGEEPCGWPCKGRLAWPV